jgi:hypothetical protein
MMKSGISLCIPCFGLKLECLIPISLLLDDGGFLDKIALNGEQCNIQIKLTHWHITII